MQATLSESKVLLDGKLEGYGREVEDKTELSLEEAAFLLERGKIEVLEDGESLGFENYFEKASKISKEFAQRYLVYKNLRERGYFIQPGAIDFRLYSRGEKSGESEAFVWVVSEREPVPLAEMIKNITAAANVKKTLLFAIVDEESDITFYEAKETKFPEKKNAVVGVDPNGSATLLDEGVIVWSPETARALHENGFFGRYEGEGDRLLLSFVETSYLMKSGVLEVADRNGRKLDIEYFVKYSEKVEDEFLRKYRIYEDMRNRGLVVKTGFKFGSHFRVYDKFPEKHSKYLVHAVPLAHVFSLQELSRAVRLAHTVRKRMLFGYEEGGEMKYVDIGRVKP